MNHPGVVGIDVKREFLVAREAGRVFRADGGDHFSERGDIGGAGFPGGITDAAAGDIFLQKRVVVFLPRADLGAGGEGQEESEEKKFSFHGFVRWRESEFRVAILFRSTRRAGGPGRRRDGRER